MQQNLEASVRSRQQKRTLSRERNATSLKPPDSQISWIMITIPAGDGGQYGLARTKLRDDQWGRIEQATDDNQGAALIAGFSIQNILGDKGYDGDDLIETICASGTQAVIPPKSNRKKLRDCDYALLQRKPSYRLFLSLV